MGVKGQKKDAKLRPFFLFKKCSVKPTQIRGEGSIVVIYLVHS